MRQQIKVITSRTDRNQTHETEVNEFLNSNIELVNIQNEVHGGNGFSKYTRAEIVTIITYKEMA